MGTHTLFSKENIWTYINGYLRKRHETFFSVVKQNFGDLWLNLFT